MNYNLDYLSNKEYYNLFLTIPTERIERLISYEEMLNHVFWELQHASDDEDYSRIDDILKEINDTF